MEGLGKREVAGSGLGVADKQKEGMADIAELVARVFDQ